MTEPKSGHAAFPGPNTRIRDVSVYTRALMKVAQSGSGDVAAEQWTEAYERGLRMAIERKDLDGLAALVSLYMNRHDLDGSIETSIVEVEFALRMVGDYREGRALLLCCRASLHAASGMAAAAAQSLDEALQIIGGTPNTTVGHRYASTRVMLDCVSLDFEATTAVIDRIRFASGGTDSMFAWFSMSWLVPLLLSGESPREAGPWARQLRLETERTHQWRHADGLAFEYMLATALGTSTSDPTETIRSTRNWLALSRVLVTGIRLSLLRRDLEATRTLVDEMARLIPRAVPAFRDGWAGFVALLGAYSLPDRPATTPAPSEVTLQNLGATLATMEAVAIAGSQADALAWLAAARSFPAGVRTSPEWAVSVDRMVALLLLRAGDPRGAARAFKAAAAWSADAGFIIESAIARLQLAELVTRTPMSLGEPRTTARRERAWRDLVQLGIDPAFQAYVITHITGRGSSGLRGEVITRRETQVLELLAKGRSYREAADDLGLKWKTVASHAFRAYAKLDVKNKVEAVEVAQKMGIL